MTTLTTSNDRHISHRFQYTLDAQQPSLPAQFQLDKNHLQLQSQPRNPLASQIRPDIFSPRPETPSTPAQFPFLASPTPPSKRTKAAPSPPTPPRPRARRQAFSDQPLKSKVNGAKKLRGKTSFEVTLDAFPPPPPRTPHFFRSLPLPLALRKPSSPLRQSTDSDGRDGLDSGSDDSDCRTITGIPATPSTAHSEWDNFWSEPPSPAELDIPKRRTQKLTEAALIREAYLKLRISDFDTHRSEEERMGFDDETERRIVRGEHVL